MPASLDPVCRYSAGSGRVCRPQSGYMGGELVGPRAELEVAGAEGVPGRTPLKQQLMVMDPGLLVLGLGMLLLAVYRWMAARGLGKRQVKVG